MCRYTPGPAYGSASGVTTKRRYAPEGNSSTAVYRPSQRAAVLVTIAFSNTAVSANNCAKARLIPACTSKLFNNDGASSDPARCSS